MNEIANRNTFLFLVSCFCFNGNAQNLQVQGNNHGPNQVAGGGVQGPGNNPNQKPVAGGGVQGQGYDPNQNQVAGGGGKVKGNIQMEKMTVSKFFK